MQASWGHLAGFKYRKAGTGNRSRRRTRRAYRSRHRLLHRHPRSPRGIIGPVTGIEYEPELAARAKANFAGNPNVEIVEGDGALVSFDQADVIYVNAGCTRPAESWLDRLADGGRLILPMTSDQGFGANAPERMASSGAVFRIKRCDKDYFATWISAVA